MLFYWRQSGFALVSHDALHRVSKSALTREKPTRRISADVYVYQTRRTKQDGSPDQQDDTLPRIYVALVGAGNTQI